MNNTAHHHRKFLPTIALLGLVLAGGAACGNDGSSDKSTLQGSSIPNNGPTNPGNGGTNVATGAVDLLGSWGPAGNTDKRGLVFAFDDDGTFVILLYQVLADGSTGVDLTSGNYQLRGNQLTMNPTKGTCAGAGGQLLATVQRSGNRLQMIDSTGDRWDFVLGNAPTISKPKAGCVDANGFTPSS